MATSPDPAAGPDDADQQPSPVDGLPDLVLEHVLALLSIEELLLARLVCRRWRRLVGSQVVWRHRRMPDVPLKLSLSAAIVRIAPCIAWLDVGGAFGPCPGPYDPHTYEQLATTRLSVKDVLSVQVGSVNLYAYIRQNRLILLANQALDNEQPAGGMEAAIAPWAQPDQLYIDFEHRVVQDQPGLDVAIVLNQLGLGGVKRLLLYFCGTRDPGDELLGNLCSTKPRFWRPCELELLRRVLAHDGLRHLRLYVRGEGLLPEAEAQAVVPAAVGRPSLRVLEVDGGFPRPVVDFLLAKHAATLEEASFEGNCNVPALPPDAALLARAGRLRVLHVPLWPGLAELPQAATLRDLTLTINHRSQALEERRAALAAGRCFLGATGVTPGLQSLTLAGFDADEALDLVAAVAAADPADHPLSFLMLVTPRLADDPMLLWRSQKPSPSYYSRPLTEELAEPCLRRLSEELLPSLRHLSELVLFFPPGPEFFTALDADGVPALTELRVVSYGYCTHRWLHDSGAPAALHRVPRLHVRCLDPVVSGDECAQLIGDGLCAACAMPCHELLVDQEMPFLHPRSVVFYAHDDDEGCCSVKGHPRDWLWMRV